MIDERIVVYVLAFVGNDAAIAMAFGTFAFENKI